MQDCETAWVTLCYLLDIKVLRQLKIILMAVVMMLGPSVSDIRAGTLSVLHNFGTLTNVSGVSPQAELIQGSDGTLYGTTSKGDATVRGSIFKVQPDGSGFTVLKIFTNPTDGDTPSAALLLVGDTLYGTTDSGGNVGLGNVFKVNTDGTGFQTLKSFGGYPSGVYPSGALVASGTKLFGTTLKGGGNGYGTVFSLNTDGTGYAVVLDLITSEYGSNPSGSLTLIDSTLYAATLSGGSGHGVLFKVGTDGKGYTALKVFLGSDGDSPNGGLAVSGTTLYGTTRNGGAFGNGTVFKVNTDGTGFATLEDFPPLLNGTNVDGATPYARLLIGGTSLYGEAHNGGMGGQGTMFTLNLDGTGFTVLKNFSANNPADGLLPDFGLISDGSKLYGAIGQGGSNGLGIIFRANLDGSQYTGLKSFAYANAFQPQGGLVLAGDLLFGVTYSGGDAGTGTIYKLNTNGSGYSVMKSFESRSNGGNTDGANPSEGLTTDGEALFGTTSYGGSTDNGTVFRINTDGSGFSVLKQFSQADGSQPAGVLLLNGNVLFGTTTAGGSSNKGTIFRINSDGSGFSVLKSFFLTDGFAPTGALAFDGDHLYGTTSGLISGTNWGKVFKIRTDGSDFAVIYTFSRNFGMYPRGGVVLNGNTLYGTTYYGGSGLSQGNGTVFKLNTDGSGFAVIAGFPDNPNPMNPAGLPVLIGNTLFATLYWSGNTTGGALLRVNTDATGYNILTVFNSSIGTGPTGRLLLYGNALYGSAVYGGELNAGTVFAWSLFATPTLFIDRGGNGVVLSWSDATYSLQSSPTITGGFTNVAGAPSPYSPASSNLNANQQFFRLIGN